MDAMLERLNRIYPNSKYVYISKYEPKQWLDKEYNSKYDNKAALNRWKSKALSFEEACIKVEDGYQLTTKREMYEYLYPIFDKRGKPNLTQASMETLAIIAYNPKITRAEIEAIRGVNSDGTIYKLLEFNLIENVGKADLPGKPTMYATTPNFLKMFGMSSLEELPELPKYKLDENQQLVIDDIIPSEDQSTIEKEEIASDETISEAPMPERENVDVIKNDNI